MAVRARVLTKLFVALIACSAQLCSASKSLPAGVPTCKRSDPDIHECVRKAIDNSLHIITKGDPNLGLPVLDPMTIKSITIDTKKNDGRPVDLDLSFSDVTVTGAQHASITKANADWDNEVVSFEASFTTPIDMKGQYNVDGNLLIMPIQGTGTFEITLEGFKAHVKVHGKLTDVGGVKYWKVDRLAFTFDVQHITSRYDDLFNGNKELGDSMNKFINENWRDIVTEMTPAIEASYSNFFHDVAAKVFDQVPFDQIAPP